MSTYVRPANLPLATRPPNAGLAPNVGALPRGVPPGGRGVLLPGQAPPSQIGASKAEIQADPYYGERSRSFNDPFPAWNPDVRPLLEIGTATVNATTTQELVGVVIPPNNVAYITGFGQDAPSAAFQEVTWQLLIGGRIVLTIPAVAQVASFSSRLNLRIPVSQGMRVSVVVTTGANSRALSALLEGIVKGRDTRAPEAT